MLRLPTVLILVMINCKQKYKLKIVDPNFSYKLETSVFLSKSLHSLYFFPKTSLRHLNWLLGQETNWLVMEDDGAVNMSGICPYCPSKPQKICPYVRSTPKNMSLCFIHPKGSVIMEPKCLLYVWSPGCNLIHFRYWIAAREFTTIILFLKADKSIQGIKSVEFNHEGVETAKKQVKLQNLNGRILEYCPADDQMASEVPD